VRISGPAAANTAADALKRRREINEVCVRIGLFIVLILVGGMP